MHVLCTHIKWDTSGDDGTKPPRLPASLVVEADIDNSDDDSQIIVDAMSDAVGFCVESFNYRILSKPVFAVVKGNKYWNGKEWVTNKSFAKVFTQRDAAVRNCLRVWGDNIEDLTE